MASRSRRLCLKLAFVALIGSGALSHDTITTKLTWSREVSRIFYRRCINCHSDQGTAFSLTNYEAARPWAQAIKEEVLTRRMPPWFAVKGFGDFRNDAGLTQEEMEIISDWVEGGAPKGEDNLLPPLPTLSTPRNQSQRAASSIVVKGDTKLQRTATVSGIRPVKLAQGSSVRVIAERPDGSLVPLVWIYNYDPDFPQTYYFKSVQILPRGTSIRMSPENQGTVALMLTARPRQGS